MRKILKKVSLKKIVAHIIDTQQFIWYIKSGNTRNYNSDQLLKGM